MGVPNVTNTSLLTETKYVRSWHALTGQYRRMSVYRMTLSPRALSIARETRTLTIFRAGAHIQDVGLEL